MKPSTMASSQRSTLPRCEPLALCEALVAVTSGVLLWMGLWDLIEEIVPAVWYAKVLMIVIGGGGLFLMGQLYHGQQLQARNLRVHPTCTASAQYRALAMLTGARR